MVIQKCRFAGDLREYENAYNQYNDDEIVQKAAATQRLKQQGAQNDGRRKSDS